MFDIGFLELSLICVIGLFVLGPERMPHAVKWLGRAFGKLRRTVNDISREINAQLELEELKDSIREQKENLDLSNDIQEIKNDVHAVARDYEQIAQRHTKIDFETVELSQRKAVNE